MWNSTPALHNHTTLMYFFKKGTRELSCDNFGSFHVNFIDESIHHHEESYSFIFTLNSHVQLWQKSEYKNLYFSVVLVTDVVLHRFFCFFFMGALTEQIQLSSVTCTLQRSVTILTSYTFLPQQLDIAICALYVRVVKCNCFLTIKL